VADADGIEGSGEPATSGEVVGLPPYDGLRRPFLEALGDGNARNMSEVIQLVADAIDLDPVTRELRLPSGAGILDHRLGWVRTSLVKAGLVEQPRPSTVAISENGRTILATLAGPLTHVVLLERCPSYANWIEDMGGELRAEQREQSSEPTAWMVRAGQGGAFASAFVERSLVAVGWSATGDVTGQSRDELFDIVTERFPDVKRNQIGQITNTLYHLANTISTGDLIVTPEPASRTVLFGRVCGPYAFLPEPLVHDQQHSRPVSWFARIGRDEFSYGARNSLGSLLTLTRPGHEAELLRLAEAHAADRVPSPVVPGVRRGTEAPVPQRVTIPANAGVPAGAGVAEFHTNPLRLLQLMDDLETGELALPDFQRSFVWAPDATRELIVSMIRSFPAGALLFLQGGASTFAPRAAEGAPPLTAQPSRLVLDGQQRLTSLYQALSGVGQSRFFLDIGGLISGAEVNEAVRALSADRASVFASLGAQADALMMPLTSVRGGGAARWRDEVVDLRDDEDPAAVRTLLRAVETAYIDPLARYAFPVTILPQTTALEAVCTIFETLNRTGKPLTPFELISARAFAGGHSLRDYWSAATAEYPVLADFDVEPYYILQVIALRLGATCKRSAVLGLPADSIAREWQSAVADLAGAISMLRDECGVLVRKWLPYQPMLIPLASAWRQVAASNGPAQGALRAQLKRWFWRACFTGEYESSSVSLAERDTPVLRAWLAGGDEPPVVRDFAWDPERWRSVTVRQQGLYASTMALTLTQHPRDFHTGAPLTREVIEAGKIDDHHVFPRGHLTATGRGADVDSALNHCLIDRMTNNRIGKSAPSVYLGEIRAVLGTDLDRVLASHYLPTGSGSPLVEDDFDAFLSWRIDRLADALADEAGVITALSTEADPQRMRLDARIEAAELGVRKVVLQQLQEDVAVVPSHILQKVRERLTSAGRKLPGSDSDRSLARQLEYCDLGDLLAIITSPPAWPRFATTFGTKEMLNARFVQLSDLRNAIRHSRPVNAVMIKDGEAALLWFGAVLAAAGGDIPSGLITQTAKNT
jgi:hypothetical protein